MPSLIDTRCSESVEPVGDIASHSFARTCLEGKLGVLKTKKIYMIFNEFKFRIHIVHICKNYVLAFSVTNHLV